MSRVHDALRRAGQDMPPVPEAQPQQEPVEVQTSSSVALAESPMDSVAVEHTPRLIARELLRRIQEVPFTPSSEAHLLDPSSPHQAPAEEFRTLRTRINHIQTLQPLTSVVVTSPSPAEGKSFAAVNLALAESQLEDNPTLLVDCDFRRPNIHNMFQMERSPGLTDYLLGRAELEDCIKKIAGLNLFVLPAGSAVINPLELLNLREMRLLVDQFKLAFNWAILDSPPLLFAADANLLSTICSGTVLVVRIGATTIDSVTRAMQSLCENNVLGIVVNGARRGELYSKYTYYHSSYYTGEEPETEPVPTPAE